MGRCQPVSLGALRRVKCGRTGTIEYHVLGTFHGSYSLSRHGHFPLQADGAPFEDVPELLEAERRRCPRRAVMVLSSRMRTGVLASAVPVSGLRCAHHLGRIPAIVRVHEVHAPDAGQSESGGRYRRISTPYVAGGKWTVASMYKISPTAVRWAGKLALGFEAGDHMRSVGEWRILHSPTGRPAQECKR